MADAVDHANEITENELAWALRSHYVPKNTMVYKDCVACGEVLPEVRQQMYAKFCIDCATDKEKKQAQYAN